MRHWCHLLERQKRNVFLTNMHEPPSFRSLCGWKRKCFWTSVHWNLQQEHWFCSYTQYDVQLLQYFSPKVEMDKETVLSLSHFNCTAFIIHGSCGITLIHKVCWERLTTDIICAAQEYLSKSFGVKLWLASITCKLHLKASLQAFRPQAYQILSSEMSSLFW
jgi:hypothetical protein